MSISTSRLVSSSSSTTLCKTMIFNTLTSSWLPTLFTSDLQGTRDKQLYQHSWGSNSHCSGSGRTRLVWAGWPQPHWVQQQTSHYNLKICTYLHVNHQKFDSRLNWASSSDWILLFAHIRGIAQRAGSVNTLMLAQWCASVITVETPMGFQPLLRCKKIIFNKVIIIK